MVPSESLSSKGANGGLTPPVSTPSAATSSGTSAAISGTSSGMIGCHPSGWPSSTLVTHADMLIDAATVTAARRLRRAVMPAAQWR